MKSSTSQLGELEKVPHMDMRSSNQSLYVFSAGMSQEVGRNRER